MEESIDPDAPDTTNGDFFCRLCFTRINSEQTWSFHIAGKKHIKNVAKFRNGLPKRNIDVEEDSFERLAKYERYDVLKERFIEESTKRKIEEILQTSHNITQSSQETSYDDFEKKLNKLLENNCSAKNLKQNDSGIFCKDNFNKQIDYELLGKSKNRKYENKRTLYSSDCRNYAVKENLLVNSTSKRKKTDDKVKKKYDSDTVERSPEEVDEGDLAGIFENSNDQKHCYLYVIDEAENTSSEKKSTNPSTSNFDDIDSDETTPELLDDLNSCINPKANSFKQKISSESLSKYSVGNDVKRDDPDCIADIITQKLEVLPTKSFFQIIMKKLGNMHLKDFDELSMLLKIISQAQDVCKTLPPHLQSMIKARMSQCDSESISVPVQNLLFSQASSVTTVRPVVSQHAPRRVVQSYPQSASHANAKYAGQSFSQPVPQRVVQSYPQSASHTNAKYAGQSFSVPAPQQVVQSYPQSASHANAKHVAQSFSHTVPQSFQSYVTYPVLNYHHKN